MNSEHEHLRDLIDGFCKMGMMTPGARKSLLLAIREVSSGITDRIPMPTGDDMAAGMTTLGMLWLKTHAPHRLKELRATPVPDSVVANLRHAYLQLVEGVVKDQRAFAEGLIAPAIRALEGAKPARPKDAADPTYPDAERCAQTLENCQDDLLTEAKFVRWQGKEIERLTACIEDRPWEKNPEQAMKRIKAMVALWGDENSDEAVGAFNTLGYLMGLEVTKPASLSPVEVWNGNRKVTVYPGFQVLRVWGSNMDTGMSDEPFSLEAVQSAMDWLYAMPESAPLTEPLTDTFVQTVPDKCDRIVWRNRYHHLSLLESTAATTHRNLQICRECGGLGDTPPCERCGRLTQPQPVTDYSLKSGDEVTHPTWELTKLYVVDINWALGAAAIHLGDEDGNVVVWPVAGLRKVTEE